MLITLYKPWLYIGDYSGIKAMQLTLQIIILWCGFSKVPTFGAIKRLW